MCRAFETVPLLFHCQVRDQFGARVIFPQKSSDDDTDTITIIGRKEKAEAARDHLLKLIKDLVCEGRGGEGRGGEG